MKTVSFVRRKFNAMFGLLISVGAESFMDFNGVAMETPFRAFSENRYLNTLNCNRTEHWFEGRLANLKIAH